MRFLRVLTPLLCLAPIGLAQLTMDQKISDFNQLAALYAKRYAPYELRRDVFGFDLYNIQPWLAQVAKTSDDVSFYDVCVKYVASLLDSHDEFTLPTFFEAWLHMDLDIYEGKVLIGFIDRSYLPARTYPFVVGDEIVSVDGTAAADLVTAFLPYAVNGEGNQTSRMRLAAASITDRYQGWMPIAGLVGDNAIVVVKRQNGNSETYTIPWDKFGTPLTIAGVVPTPHTLRASAAEGQAGHPRGEHLRRNNPWNVWEGPAAQFDPDPTPGYMQTLIQHQYGRALAPAAPLLSVGLSPFDNPSPIFNPPSGFKLRLGSKSTDQFVSGTFPAGSSTIGFIRIATMAPTSQSTALTQFYNEILFFQANTDGLVIDVMDNGGGNGCYSQSLASGLIPYTFRGFAQEIRATATEAENFMATLVNAQETGAPQWVIDLYTSYLSAVQSALAGNRGRTGSLPACGPTFDAAPLTDTKGNILAYTKPIVVLTDSFTLSAAEIFTMLMQDAKRATIFGSRTDGGGGFVVSYDATVYSEGSARVTGSLITRAQPVQTPGFPLSQYYDGMGIYPDVVQDYQTLDNLLNGGKTFVTAFTNQILTLIQAQK